MMKHVYPVGQLECDVHDVCYVETVSTCSASQLKSACFVISSIRELCSWMTSLFNWKKHHDQTAALTWAHFLNIAQYWFFF